MAKSEAYSWINVYHRTDLSNYWGIYLTAIYYWSVTMVTVGYGDVVAITRAEKLCNIFLTIIACCFYAYLMNSSNFYL